MSMYRIKPLSVVPDNIELPKCMYHIKPLTGIQLGSTLSESLSPKKVKMDPELQAIEDRQLQVIAKLRKLRDTVDDMIKKSGGAAQPQQAGVGKRHIEPATIASSGGSTVSYSAALGGVELPNELVIEANPIRPPLSLLFLQKLNPSVKTVTHTHSSCDKGVDDKLNNLFSRETSAVAGTIRVVWKKLTDSRITPPKLGSSGVERESNVARYLSRILAAPNSTLNYDAIPLEDLVLVDNVLDSSDLVDSSPDQFLSSLQSYVQSRSGRNVRTVADFVGYSTLRYLTQQQPKKSIQKSLVDWMNCLTNEVPC